MTHLQAILAATLLFAAGNEAESISAPPLTDFVIGYQAAIAEQSIREEVPIGETVEQWDRMVTTQWFKGLSRFTTPEAFLDGMLAGVGKRCPGVTNDLIKSLTVSKRHAVQSKVECPFLPETSKPETFLILVIAGPEDVHVKQVAFRGGYKTADEQWARAYLANVRFCGGADKDQTCQVK